MDIVNSPGLWVACSFMVIMTIIQAAVYAKKAMNTAREMGFSMEQINSALRAGAIGAVGPSCAIGVGVVALMAIIGGPVAWLRLSVIGALSYELRNVELAGEAFGAAMGSFSLEQMAATIWAMGLAGCFWQLNVVCLAPSYDKVLKKVTKGNPRVLNIIMTAAIVGIFSRSGVGYFMKISGSTWACLAGAVASAFLTKIVVEKMKVNWMKEWALPIAMLVGMAVAVITL